MTTSINLVVDDHMELISEFYPGLYTNLVPQQGEVKPRRRRRRKKNKGEDGGGGGGLKKRKLSEEQVSMLEMSFGNEHKLESERKDRLASELGLDPRQVAVWFQNRRARWKSKKLEEQYSKLKMEHDSTVVEKCLLESEVLKLKEQLCDAQKEIQRLERCTDGASSNSPSTSFSVEPMEPPPFLGDSGWMLQDSKTFFISRATVTFMAWSGLIHTSDMDFGTGKMGSLGLVIGGTVLLVISWTKSSNV